MLHMKRLAVKQSAARLVRGSGRGVGLVLGVCALIGVAAGLAVLYAQSA